MPEFYFERNVSVCVRCTAHNMVFSVLVIFTAINKTKILCSVDAINQIQ